MVDLQEALRGISQSDYATSESESVSSGSELKTISKGSRRRKGHARSADDTERDRSDSRRFRGSMASSGDLADLMDDATSVDFEDDEAGVMTEYAADP